MADMNPLEGAMGGWWTWSSVGVPVGGPSSVCRVEAIAGGFITEFQVVPGASTNVGGVWTAIAYTIVLRYQGASGLVTLTAATPIADPALGHATTGVARAGWTAPWRFALVFRCSTWDGAAYAADGFVKLYLNGQSPPLLEAVNVTIPCKLNTGQVRYTVAALADADRLWARIRASVPATGSAGAWTTGPPADLVYSEEFTGGTYDAAWTPVDLYPGGGFIPDPHLWPDCGGDTGWGMSIYGCGPFTTGGVANHSYAGLTRTVTYPPDGTWPPGDGGIEPGGEPEPPDPPSSAHLEARYIRRLRRAPHIANEHKRVFYRSFELDLERGQALATGQGSDPVVLLRISRDGGQTWGEEIRMAVGQMGDYQARVLARRLGHSRDTVFEIVVSDPIAWSIVDAWLDLEAGTS